MTEENAQKFAQAWLQSFNSRDLDAILSHYAENVEFTSPIVIRLNYDASGTIHGKQALRAYLQKGLAAFPDLKFEFYHALAGVNSVTLYYRSINNMLAAEVMMFNPEGRVERVLAHYTQGS